MQQKPTELNRWLKVTFVFLFLYSISCQLSYAQEEKLEYEAKSLEGGKAYKKLVGNVKFTQKTTIIYCDSAFAYDESNSMEAFGHVRIEDLEDSVTITSDKLFYDGNSRIAELRSNVIYVDDSIQLFTDNLDYDMTNKSATYFKGGRIIDGDNTLSSINGDYDTEGKLMIFKDAVKLVTPDYRLESDDLFYNIITKMARTSSETTIITDDGKLLKSKQRSEFDTEKGTSAFMLGEVDTEKYLLRGNELFFNNQLGFYSAKGDVYLLAKLDSVIITGEEANFWQNKGMAKVFGDPLLKKPLGQDTLYLRADTLISLDDSLEANKRLLAFHNVQIYKSDLQGKADSLVYYLSDSSISFYSDPILWNEGSQITADTIHLLINKGMIDQLKTALNSFIISEDSTKNFNQIKGRHMVAYFEGKNIKDVDVRGNGESIYFVADEENTETLMGMNQIICSNMKIIFKENQVNDIRFYTNPDGNFVPPHELKDSDKQLEGFAWRIDERPSRRQILVAPSKAEEMRKRVDSMIEDEEREKSNLQKTVEENVDIDKIKEKLKAPIKEIKQ